MYEGERSFFSARVPQAINANKYWSSKVSANNAYNLRKFILHVFTSPVLYVLILRSVRQKSDVCRGCQKIGAVKQVSMVRNVW